MVIDNIILSVINTSKYKLEKTNVIGSITISKKIIKDTDISVSLDRTVSYTGNPSINTDIVDIRFHNLPTTLALKTYYEIDSAEFKDTDAKVGQNKDFEAKIKILSNNYSFENNQNTLTIKGKGTITNNGIVIIKQHIGTDDQTATTTFAFNDNILVEVIFDSIITTIKPR